MLPDPPSLNRLPLPHLVSSLLNAEAAARRLQQQHEVQLCQECDSSDPLVFLLVSPLSPYCQSEECTSVEMSLWDTTQDVEALQFQKNTKTRSHRSCLLDEKQPSLTYLWINLRLCDILCPNCYYQKNGGLKSVWRILKLL